MTYSPTNPITVAHVLDLVSREIGTVTTQKELTVKLAKLGYGFRDTWHGRMLTTLPHGVEITPIPALYGAL